MGRYFGTDGFRSLAGGKLTPQRLLRIGFFIGQRAKKVIIGNDSRISGAMLASALKSGIMAAGADVYDLKIASTPAVTYALRKGFDYAIIVSASHNPYYDNGVKILDSNGHKISDALESEIEDFIDDLSDLHCRTHDNIGREFDALSLLSEYIDFLCRDFKMKNDIELVIDAANGATSSIIHEVITRTGLNALIINDVPDGTNINDKCGALYINNLIGQYSNKLVVAFDGDGDRIQLLYKDRLITGDEILFILTKFFIASGRMKRRRIVTTVMANSGLLVALERYNVSVETTAVGDRHVAAALADDLLGGEQSGHIIINDKLPGGDGILTMLELLSALDFQRIEDYLDDLILFPQYLVNIKVKNKTSIMANEKLKENLYQDNKFIQGQGRLLLRPSGTEEVIRVMVECNDQMKVDQIIKKYQRLIQEADI